MSIHGFISPPTDGQLDLDHWSFGTITASSASPATIRFTPRAFCEAPLPDLSLTLMLETPSGPTFVPLDTVTDESGDHLEATLDQSGLYYLRVNPQTTLGPYTIDLSLSVSPTTEF